MTANGHKTKITAKETGLGGAFHCPSRTEVSYSVRRSDGRSRHGSGPNPIDPYAPSWVDRSEPGTVALPREIGPPDGGVATPFDICISRPLEEKTVSTSSRRPL